jgi:aerobic-type carbon monoxide dehydrogenase small subunit (CoxS/CutS family)
LTGLDSTEILMSKSKRNSKTDAARKDLSKRLLRLNVNGETKEVATETNKTLLEVLREDLGLTGTKHGCELGECGTCAVLMNGAPVLSCLVLGVESEESEITTVEGLMHDGRPHPLQRAFADLGAAQCGYCIPGILLTAKALLDKNPHPSRTEIRQALSGNLCRCTGYTKILQAVELAAKEGNESFERGMEKD